MKGIVFNIQRFSINDGPGIRTTVFLKGCRLRCLWCHNPESLNPQPELIYHERECIGCRRCVEVCPQEVHRFVEDRHLLARDLCQQCGLCTKECPTGSLELVGREYTVKEVFDEIMRDEIFYRNSGGGITLSGGEPTFQVEFAIKLLKKCKEKVLSTAVDTCGYTPWSVLKRLLPFTDLFLYDLKHLDPQKHKEYTGVFNDLILENARRLSFNGAKMEIRVPVIPGYNDSEDNIRMIGKFVDELSKKEKVKFVPYHHFAGSKYRQLGKTYPIGPIGIAKVEESMRRFYQILKGSGMEIIDG